MSHFKAIDPYFSGLQELTVKNDVVTPQDACFTNVDKFVTPTSACSCLLHMHAGVYYTGTQVSMTPARRCPWYLHADVYYTCLQVTIAQKVTQMGMQLSMTLARRCLWQQHADVFDTCTQIHCDQDDVIIILIHLDTYDYDLLTSWQVDIYCPDNSETFRIIYKLSIQSKKCTWFFRNCVDTSKSIQTIHKLSRKSRNFPEIYNMSRKSRNFLDNRKNIRMI